ncbi:MAG: uroporphyrinogen-III synthase [Sphingomonas sp.]
MTRPIAVLRPEPGNRATAAAIEAAGHTAIRLPLFEVRPIAWRPPDPAAFDALLLTSANALRHGGAGLASLRALPVHAVGEATAATARGAGFSVAATGTGGAAALIADASDAGVRHALHLAGRDRTMIAPGGIVARVVAVYASAPQPIGNEAVGALAGSVVLVHSARAGARLAAVVDAAGIDRARIALVAIGAEAAARAGPGWQTVVVAPGPRAEALIEAAIALAD